MATRKQGLELRRKKQAVLALWNRLGRELRGGEASENTGNLRTAGQLLERCQDKQGLFETRARKFLNQSWRSYRRIGDFLRAWESLGDSSQETKRDSDDSTFTKLSEPSGVNYQGYWKPPPGWDDPRNLSPEDLREKARAIRERLQRPDASPSAADQAASTTAQH